MKHPLKTTDKDLLKHGIVYSGKGYTIREATFKNSKGFEVYREGVTHATRCAIIGWEGIKGFERALAEIERRTAAEV